MLTYKFSKEGIDTYSGEAHDGRTYGVACLRNVLTRVQCNGIISLKYTIAKGIERPQQRDQAGRFLKKETALKADTVYLKKDIGEPRAEVWYHLDLMTDTTCSTISAVTDGEIICPTFQTGWGHLRCQWLEEWRLLRNAKELNPERRWRATVLRQLTSVDKKLIEAAINRFWEHHNGK